MHRKSLQPLSKGKKATKTDVKTVALMSIDIKQFFRNFTRRLHGEPELSDALVTNLISRLLNTHEEELSCDEVFALVDEYAEASQRGEDVASLEPIIRQHLDMCRECEEEYQALLSVLEGTKSD